MYLWNLWVNGICLINFCFVGRVKDIMEFMFYKDIKLVILFDVK